MSKYYDSLGVMIDLSRNAVMNLDSLKKFIKIIKKMGYNTVFLYMEDTYEVEGEPYFGYMRSRYSIEDMKEINRFGKEVGVEMIPCIQTLAHLATFLRWGKVNVDCDNIMLTDDDRTYELIDHMFKTLRECFDTDKLHIGMDEAHMLGRGKHLDKFGYETTNTVISRHLKKVNELAGKYGFTALMWSDMFIRPLLGGQYYTNKDLKVPDEVKSAIPENVHPVYWDYYHDQQSDFDAMIKIHKQMSKNTWFGGGCWCWQGMIPHNKYSIETMLPAIKACKEEKIKNIFMTLWGDNGGECSHFSQLPSLLVVAEGMKGNFDEEKIKAKFKSLVGISYDDFMKIDLPNDVDGERVLSNNPSKYMLYSDPFLGFLDWTVNDEGAKKYAEYEVELAEVAKKTRKYGYLFNSASTLCGVLKYKYDIGVKTRKAYKAGDKKELERLAKEEYTELEKAVRKYYTAFDKQWTIENRPSGFEIQDNRLGGLIMRVSACRKRLLAYVKGDIDAIEELDVEILPYGGKEQGKSIAHNGYARSSSANVI